MSRGGATVLTSGNSNEKPQDLLSVLDELEYFAMADESGSEINVQYATTKMRIDRMNVALRSTLTGGFFTIIFAPITTAAVQNYIPIFGDFSGDIFSKFYAYLLSLSYTIAYSCFFAYIGTKYISPICRAIIRNLFLGVFFGSLIKLAIAFTSYSFLYLKVLTDSNIIRFIGLFEGYKVSTNFINKLYYFLITFKKVLLPSLGLVMISALMLVVVPLISTVITVYKNREVELD